MTHSVEQLAHDTVDGAKSAKSLIFWAKGDLDLNAPHLPLLAAIYEDEDEYDEDEYVDEEYDEEDEEEEEYDDTDEYDEEDDDDYVDE